MKKYFSFWIVIWIGLILLTRGSMADFSQQSRDMLTRSQPSRNNTLTNPCSQSVSGNPIVPDRASVTVIFVCGTVESRNIISWQTIRVPKIVGVLEEIIRINNLNSSIIDSVSCTVDGRKVNSLFEGIAPGNQITCLYRQ